ncbi:COPI associated protein [Tritrichomonas foetus]|uniref:COPI associated protein n=1 Tax=Tritrichomonas foetus TaxID=1144522 RepID=A0A1J4JHP9_9EUKA|nr:COPI associated protein [Tritrichomonas foetus]|eukprot:OHS98249.1 COPI associated protein [Tritrichomonas foetus]
MGFKFNVPFILQCFSIACGIFGIIVAIVHMAELFSIGQLILSLFAIFFSLVIIACEVYVMDFFKYFAFMLTFWGKGLSYLFMAFFLFQKRGIGLAAMFIFLALFIFYIIAYFVFKNKGVSCPLLQKNSPPQFQTVNSDYYEGVGDGGSKRNTDDYEQKAQTDAYYEQPVYQ